MASGGAKRCHNFTSPARKREVPHALVCIKPARVSIGPPTNKNQKPPRRTRPITLIRLSINCRPLTSDYKLWLDRGGSCTLHYNIKSVVLFLCLSTRTRRCLQSKPRENSERILLSFFKGRFFFSILVQCIVGKWQTII